MDSVSSLKSCRCQSEALLLTPNFPTVVSAVLLLLLVYGPMVTTLCGTWVTASLFIRPRVASLWSWAPLSPLFLPHSLVRPQAPSQDKTCANISLQSSPSLRLSASPVPPSELVSARARGAPSTGAWWLGSTVAGSSLSPLPVLSLGVSRVSLSMPPAGVTRVDTITKMEKRGRWRLLFKTLQRYLR